MSPAYFAEYARHHRAATLARATLAAYHAERKSTPKSTDNLLQTERRHSVADARAWVAAELHKRRKDCTSSRPAYDARVAAIAVMEEAGRSPTASNNHTSHLFRDSPVRMETISALGKPHHSTREPANETPVTARRVARASVFFEDTGTKRAQRVEAWALRRSMECERRAAVRAFDLAVDRNGPAQEQLAQRTERGVLGTGHCGAADTRAGSLVDLEAIVARAAALPLSSRGRRGTVHAHGTSFSSPPRTPGRSTRAASSPYESDTPDSPSAMAAAELARLAELARHLEVART